jgi:membrane-associated phospholipid phosphatase
MSYISSIFYNLGQNGPTILAVITIYLLWNKKIMGFYYLLGYFLNSIVNLVLKGIFQQPRPSDNFTKFDTMMKNGKMNIFKDKGIPFNIFGMPSGHAQSCLFSTIFVFLTLRRTDILIFYLLLSIITIAQRVQFSFHTIFQTVVGAICGTIFAYLMFNFSNQKLKGKLREKPDDNAPF